MSKSKMLTMDQPATYRIRVPGEISRSWSDWVEGIKITVEWTDGSLPVTMLTGVLDQAALHRLLRRLYALGLPLISAVCVD